MSTSYKNEEVCHNQCDHYLSQDNEVYKLDEQMATQETMHFADANSGDSISLEERPDPSREDGSIDEGSYSTFLSRPVLIGSYTWSEGTQFDQTYYPWYLWAQQSQILNKLNNFGLFRGNLKIKVVLNASPFYYGAAKVTYAPLLGKMYSENIYKDSTRKWLVPYSQRRGFFIYPQDNQGGEMTLPFFWYKNWVNCSQGQDFKDLGTLEIASFTNLSNANSVAAANVTIQIFAWCENVELSAPTYSLAAQSEYKDLGPVSGPASAVARAASELATIPTIRPLALATEMVASTVSGVARNFGFTNVPNTEAERPFHPGAFHGMASTNISTPYEKLTLDDKNELSIDPRIVGLAPTDELSLKYLNSRESWIYTSSWTAAATAGTSIFNAYVIPDYVRVDATRQSTPMCHFGKLFNNWRGTIKYRIRVICSKFHRGRLRISYDPRANLSSISSTDPITTSFTKIMDIAETTEIEIDIPWYQARSYHQTMSGQSDTVEWMNSSGALPALPSSPDTWTNGTLNISVFTVQTSPVTSADIQVMVFAKAGDDFEYANPCDVPINYTYLKEQMETAESSSEKTAVVDEAPICSVNRHAENLNLIHFGETVLSLRQLMRRKNYYTTFVCKPGPDGNNSSMTINTWSFPRYPQIYGYTSVLTNAMNYTAGILTPATQYPCNMTANSVLTHTAMCFVASRGSLVYAVNVDCPDALGSWAMGRNVNVSYDPSSSHLGWSNPAVVSTYAPSAVGTPAKLLMQNTVRGASGRILTNQNTQAGLTALYPYYSPNRFTSAVGFVTSDVPAPQVSVPQEEKQDSVRITIITKPNMITHNNVELSCQADVYYMAGPDFNLYYFNNVPSLYEYTLPYPSVN